MSYVRIHIICVSICLSCWLSVCLSVYVLVCLSIYLSVCLSVCLFLCVCVYVDTSYYLLLLLFFIVSLFVFLVPILPTINPVSALLSVVCGKSLLFEMNRMTFTYQPILVLSLSHSPSLSLSVFPSLSLSLSLPFYLSHLLFIAHVLCLPPCVFFLSFAPAPWTIRHRSTSGCSSGSSRSEGQQGRVGQTDSTRSGTFWQHGTYSWCVLSCLYLSCLLFVFSSHGVLIAARGQDENWVDWSFLAAESYLITPNRSLTPPHSTLLYSTLLYSTLLMILDHVVLHFLIWYDIMFYVIISYHITLC